MQKFYKDKAKLFECNISVEGADINETKARLVLEFPNNRNLLFHGKIGDYGKCEILIPALKELEECEGEVVLEVIAESTYFESWRDNFELKTHKKVMVEVVEKENKVISETLKPQVAVIINKTTEKFETKQKQSKISPEFKKFRTYLRENEVNFNKIIKNKTEFFKLLHEYKKVTNSTKGDITIIVEEIKEEAKLLKS